MLIPSFVGSKFQSWVDIPLNLGCNVIGEMEAGWGHVTQYSGDYRESSVGRQEVLLKWDRIVS